MNSFESEGYSSKSSKNSKIENIINLKDSVIEENKVSWFTFFTLLKNNIK